MPIQSKRISLTALGIESVPGMENGNHLRVGFDPRMGFPPCGFRLYRRAHESAETVALDWARLFAKRFRSDAPRLLAGRHCGFSSQRSAAGRR